MKLGEQICMGKLCDKIWELEGYKLQSKIMEEKKNENNQCKSKKIK